MVLLNVLADSSIQIATHRIATSWEWYVIRAAGFVSAGLLFLLMLSGIGQVTGWTYKVMEPVKAWAVHKAMAIALLVSITIHVTFILLDHFVRFNLASVLVPFISHYDNGTAFLGLAIGSLAVTFGIIAAYSCLIIVLSALGWIDSRPALKRRLHYLSYLVIVLIFLHGLYIGSDLKSGLLRDLWITGGLIILIAIIGRLRRVGSLNKS